jgi:hypothetical protein
LGRGGLRAGAGRRKGSKDRTPRAKLAKAFQAAINAIPEDERIDLLAELNNFANSRKTLARLEKMRDSEDDSKAAWAIQFATVHSLGNAPQRPQPPPAAPARRVELVFTTSGIQSRQARAGLPALGKKEEGPQAPIEARRLITSAPLPADRPAVEFEAQAEAARPPARSSAPTIEPFSKKRRPDTCEEADRAADDANRYESRGRDGFEGF